MINNSTPDTSAIEAQITELETEVDTLETNVSTINSTLTRKVDKTRTPNADIHYGTSVKPANTKVTEHKAEINSASGSGFDVIFDSPVDYASLVGNYFHRSNSVGLGRTYLEIVIWFCWWK